MHRRSRLFHDAGREYLWEASDPSPPSEEPQSEQETDPRGRPPRWMLAEAQFHPLSGRLKPGGELRHDAAGAAVFSERLGDKHRETLPQAFLAADPNLHT
jgi:hypothetical protein